VRACMRRAFGAYRCIVSASVHVDAAQTNKKSRTARGIRKVATDGSSLKLVGAEVVSQPPTISQIVPASVATGRGTLYLKRSLYKKLIVAM